MLAVFVILTIVRLILPVTIFRWPLVGFAISLLIDGADWFLWQFKSYADYDRYQTWDKWLDLYMLSIAMISTLSWKDVLAKRVAGSLFVFRVIGIMLFEITHFRTILFFFPNLFETFFLFYNGYRALAKRDVLFRSGKFVALTLVILLLPKLYMEYHLHISMLNFWDVLTKFFRSEYWVQTMLLSTYITWPAGLMYFKLKQDAIEKK
jgi:hypothetical protein